MVEDVNPAWRSLWQSLEALRAYARRLRHLSQMEPLLQARPDFPRVRIGRSHSGEVRALLEGIGGALAEITRLLPQVVPAARAPASGPLEEAPHTLVDRMEVLTRLVVSLEREAFQPPPPLPPHAPPYLADAPGHDLAGSKAVALSLGIEETVTALWNALLAVLNEA